MVRLQQNYLIEGDYHYEIVSIPLWFDYNDRDLGSYEVRNGGLNSTMVRLQRNKLLKTVTFFVSSQFHYGSITT